MLFVYVKFHSWKASTDYDIESKPQVSWSPTTGEKLQNRLAQKW